MHHPSSIIIEAIMATDNINMDLYERASLAPLIDETGSILTFETDGDECSILFGAYALWHSDYDPRPWANDDDGRTHTVEQWVRKELTALLKQFGAAVADQPL